MMRLLCTNEKGEAEVVTLISVGVSRLLLTGTMLYGSKGRDVRAQSVEFRTSSRGRAEEILEELLTKGYCHAEDIVWVTKA